VVEAADAACGVTHEASQALERTAAELRSAIGRFKC